MKSADEGTTIKWGSAMKGSPQESFAGSISRGASVVCRSTCLIFFLITTLVPTEFVQADDQLRRMVTTQAIAWSEQEIAQGLQNLAAQAKVALWLDRRVDPSTSVTLQCSGELWEVVAKIAESAGLQSVVLSSVIVVAHPQHAERIASSVEWARDVAAKSPERRGLLVEKGLSWEDVTAPREIIATISALWKTEVLAEPIPHDLWRSLQLSAIDAPAALALIGGGFDLQPDLLAKPIGWQSLPQRVEYARRYTKQNDADAQQEVLAADPQAQWKVGPQGRIDLIATARGHQSLLLAQAKRTEVVGTPASGNRYSLEVKDTPVRKVIQGIANAEQWQLDWQAVRLGDEEPRITAAWKDTPAEVLIAEVCRQAGLKWMRNRGRLVITHEQQATDGE